MWGANVFTSNASETLSAVSFYATDINTEYDLYVYKNPDNGPVNSTGYSYRQAGIIEGPPGYYTKVLTPKVELLPRENFSVVINLTTRNTDFPLPVEHAIQGYSSHATAPPGQSFYSVDGGQTWSDMASFDPSENICIKAFTILPLPKAAFSADKISGNAPLTVIFNDSSTGSPITWNWSFGDGSFNVTRNPSHTFTQGGAYTISLNVTNAAGTDTLIKTNYIVVNGDKVGVFRNVSGIWYLDFNNTGVVDKTFQFGKAGDVPVIGDWNGDGTSDAAVFRPSNGDWYMNYYKDSISHKAFHFGTIDDVPVTGDWDGDGTTDAGVFRSAAGTWYLDTTKTGIVNKTFQFGKSGDIPVAGDWNGDGTADAGIFRSATGTWYLNFEKNGTTDKSFHFGIIGDNPKAGKWI
jgi:PKD repeat protein